mmetsp:Transcript_90749/g.207641  ORF Transcript_90749/g.207641 Transcript_90749/m.207641 type:complete len:828 (+) Transcript_90749:2267-4750(+)
MVPDGNPGVLSDVVAVVPPRPVPAVPRRGLLHPPRSVSVGPVDLVLLGHQPLLAVPGGEKELIEVLLGEADAPGGAAELGAGDAVGDAPGEAVLGWVPTVARWHVADEEPVAPVDVLAVAGGVGLALLADIDVCPHVHGQDGAGVGKPNVVLPVQDAPALDRWAVVDDGDPGVLPVAVPTVPPGFVPVVVGGRLLHEPGLVSVPPHNRPLLRHQPLLAIAGGEQELVELLAVERDGPGVGAGGGAHPAVPSCTAQLVPGRVPLEPRGHVADQSPATAIQGGAAGGPEDHHGLIGALAAGRPRQILGLAQSASRSPAGNGLAIGVSQARLLRLLVAAPGGIHAALANVVGVPTRVVPVGALPGNLHRSEGHLSTWGLLENSRRADSALLHRLVAGHGHAGIVGQARLLGSRQVPYCLVPLGKAAGVLPIGAEPRPLDRLGLHVRQVSVLARRGPMEAWAAAEGAAVGAPPAASHSLTVPVTEALHLGLRQAAHGAIVPTAIAVLGVAPGVHAPLAPPIALAPADEDAVGGLEGGGPAQVAAPAQSAPGAGLIAGHGLTPRVGQAGLPGFGQGANGLIVPPAALPGVARRIDSGPDLPGEGHAPLERNVRVLPGRRPSQGSALAQRAVPVGAATAGHSLAVPVSGAGLRRLRQGPDLAVQAPFSQLLSVPAAVDAGALVPCAFPALAQADQSVLPRGRCPGGLAAPQSASLHGSTLASDRVAILVGIAGLHGSRQGAHSAVASLAVGIAGVPRGIRPANAPPGVRQNLSMVGRACLPEQDLLTPVGHVVVRERHPRVLLVPMPSVPPRAGRLGRQGRALDAALVVRVPP